MKKILLLILLTSYSIFSFSQENIVVAIKIRGVKKTKTSEIKKIIETKENVVLDSLVLKNDIIRLKRLPAISHAYFQFFRSYENKYNVFINVEENFTIIPEVNFWTTTNRKFAYKIGLNDYNFLGRNIAFGGFYQNNGFDSYGINFRAPTLFSRKWGIALHHQNWVSEEPLYFDNQTANYKYQNISYEALALYQINFKHQLQFGINFFKEKYDYLSGATSPTIPQKLNVNKRLLKLVYTYDKLDYYYQYINGFKSQFYGQYVTSENEYQDDFLIFWNDFFYYKRIGEKGNWANRLRIGLASNDNTPFAPFALDNNVNLRGVGILVDRGTGSVVWNTEYRHTLYEKNWLVIQGNAFVDAGTWRNPGGSFSDFIDGKNARVYSGVGLRFISKKIFNAVFRIDYGYGLTKNASRGFVFGIGQYF
ncbi:outer membrane protein assembly factor [Tenacibaculum sp. S7007]|uniref:Outer membrane protein assembly factor n=1 Tax=Tenacibaculum pelagium TaxID=2759527 RepID=A0A839ARZ6_9FLAO|nr:outer membrane protein assembly factor [Tenacibaculum pelagium]MBA6156904.1 outer membrane protein assembly factor [Tenacibaculum pelagium]